jgi:hypothetical protein
MQTAISQQGNQNFEFTSSLKPAQRNAQHTNNHRVQRNEKKKREGGRKSKITCFLRLQSSIPSLAMVAPITTSRGTATLGAV